MILTKFPKTRSIEIVRSKEKREMYGNMFPYFSFGDVSDWLANLRQRRNEVNLRLVTCSDPVILKIIIQGFLDELLEALPISDSSKTGVSDTQEALG